MADPACLCKMTTDGSKVFQVKEVEKYIIIAFCAFFGESKVCFIKLKL